MKKYEKAAQMIIKLSKSSGSYWSKTVQEYNSTLDYTTMRSANNAAVQELKQTFPELIAEARTQEQIKADEQYVKQEYKKINVPLVDYSLFIPETERR